MSTRKGRKRTEADRGGVISAQEGPTGRIRRYLRILVYAAYFVIFCGLGGEVTIRIFYDRVRDYNMEMWRYSADLKRPLDNPDLPFHHYPNRHGEYYGVEISTNSMGFRDQEYSTEKPHDRVRILTLGDSFTLGWGVNSDSVFSHRLEAMLNTRVERYEVINMGVGNYNTTMEVELFKWKGLGLDPDIVILAYFLNDTEPIPNARSALNYPLLRSSYFGSFLFDQLTRIRSRFFESYQWTDYYRHLHTEANSEHLTANEHAVLELVGLCRDRGVDLLIVNIPELRQLDDYPFAYATDRIETMARESGIPFLDLLDDLQNHEPESLWVSHEDPHANGKAHGIIAESIYAALTEDEVLRRELKRR